MLNLCYTHLMQHLEHMIDIDMNKYFNTGNSIPSICVKTNKKYDEEIDNWSRMIEDTLIEWCAIHCEDLFYVRNNYGTWEAQFNSVADAIAFKLQFG